MKKSMMIALVVVLVAAIGFGAWRTQRPDEKVVGVATLMSQPSLDAVQEGMMEELKSRGWQEGKNIRFIIRNANQQMQAVPTIANDLAAQNVSLIVAITTPMAQAVAKVARCPIVFAAVTDPVGAGLVPDLTRGHGDITGTSDAWPYRAQLALMREILPTVDTIGVLFNPGEAASQYGIRQIRKDAPAFGFHLIEAAVNAVGDVRPVAEGLVGRVGALFLSSDNTVIGGMTGAVSVAIQRKVPLFVGDNGSVARGGIATVSVGYRELGRKTGDLVDEMLRGKRNIPPIVASGDEISVNTEAARLMGVTLPAAVLKRATHVYTEIAH